MQMTELQGGENMFCPECGNPLSDGQRFCPKCGTPVEGIGQPAGEDAAAGSNGQSADTGVGAESAGQSVNTGAGAANSGQPEDAGFNAGSAENGADNARQSAGNSGFGAGNTQNMGNTAGSSYGQQAQTGGSAGGAKGGNLDMVMRIACGVFAVFFLISALTRIPGIFSTIFNLRIVYFISTILGFAAAIVMTLSTAASAWKWSSKLKDLIFGGAVLGVLLRLLSLIISLVANLITFGGFVGGKSIFYWLGYVFVAAALFGLMYAMGCAPVIGETKEELQNNISAGFSELSGAAKDLQKKQAEKSAAKQSAAAYQAPPAGGAGYQTPPAGGAGYQADPAGYQTPPAGGAPGYGVPPMGGVGYGMPTGPARGTVAKKTDRSIWIYILLSLVTCSIYPYFFIHKLAEDVNDICEGDGESTSGILAFIFLGFITCGIYRIIWWYKLANRLQANGPRYNVPIQENGTTYVMWVLFGSLLCFIGPFIALNFVIKNTNKLCTVYNQYNGLR